MGRNKHLKILRKEARKQVSEQMSTEHIDLLRGDLIRARKIIRNLWLTLGIVFIFNIIGIIALVIQFLNK